MVRSKDMLKAAVFAITKERERVMTELHAAGVMQLIDLKTSDIGLQVSHPGEDLKALADYLLRVSSIVSVLKLSEQKLTFTQNLFGLDLPDKHVVERKDKKTLFKEAQAFISSWEKQLLQLEADYIASTRDIEAMQETKAAVQTLVELDLPVHLLRDTAHIAISAGRIAVSLAHPLQAELERETGGLAHAVIKQETKKDSFVVVIALKECIAKANFITKKYGCRPLAVPYVPDARDPRSWVEQELRKSETKKQATLAAIAKLQKKIFHEAILLREELDIFKERYEAIHKLMESRHFFVVQGWIPAEDVHGLHAIKDIIVETQEPSADDNVPVLLSNHSFLRPFELLTELYALPKYKDLDPTFVIGPIFIIFAGFMLTDFVYGLWLLLLGAILIAKFGKYSDGLKNISVSIVWIGIWSMVFGVLTGSYLGDFPKYLTGLSTEQLAIWKDPLADPLYFLILSLIVGVCYLNIGLILGAIEDIRKKEYKALLKGKIVWWLIQTGIALMYFGVPAGKWVFGATVLLIVVLAGPLGLLSITGFMGDAISFSRLFALALSTAGIAMTVNLLAQLLYGVPYVGIVLALVIFLAGHTFSFLMNALGAFVHSIRLQFVEFFGKFYEGGGEKFTPFKEERTYTGVK